MGNTAVSVIYLCTDNISFKVECDSVHSTGLYKVCGMYNIYRVRKEYTLHLGAAQFINMNKGRRNCRKHY